MKRLLLLTLVMWVCVGFALAQTTVTLRPTADGTVEQWNNNAGSACTGQTCYTQVAETTGATNCTSSSLVKGDATYNKSPTTTGAIQQYALTLTSIPDNSIIQSITVHVCEARGGSNNTSGRLRIVVNGATTTCGSTQSVVAAYADLNCAFTSLNVTKSSGTTVEIGNATTATRAIWVDAIEAQVTYIQQALKNVTGAVGVSPEVAGDKHANSGQVGDVTGAAGVSPVCCISTKSPLAATLHVATTATGVRATNTNACCVLESMAIEPVCSTCVSKWFDTASVSIATSATAVQGLGKAAAGAIRVVPTVATSRGMHKAATAAVSASPAVTSAQSGSAVAEESLHLSSAATAVGPGAQAANVVASLGVATQADESAISSTGVAQSLQMGFVTTIGVQVSRPTSFTVNLAASASALGRQPKAKAVVLVSH